MNKKTIISIITPVYNREKDIVAAINCVKKLKVPKGFDYEHIIIDDGSKDRTVESVERLKYSKLRFVKLKKNKGVNGARNSGMKIAKGDYLLLYDSDDFLTNDALKEINKALEKTKRKFEIYYFLTKDKNTNKVMGRSKKYYKPINYKELLSGKVLGGEFIALISKSVSKILFDENRMAFEDFYWNKVLKKFESLIVVDKAIREYRHEDPNRLCKQLVKPENAQKRAEDYKLYIKTFEKDYKKFGLKKQLADTYLRTGVYLATAKRKKEAKKFFKKSIQLNINCKNLVVYFMSFFGSGPFKKILRIMHKRA